MNKAESKKYHHDYYLKNKAKYINDLTIIICRYCAPLQYSINNYQLSVSETSLKVKSGYINFPRKHFITEQGVIIEIE